jgi:hypothetical protein
MLMPCNSCPCVQLFLAVLAPKSCRFTVEDTLAPGAQSIAVSDAQNIAAETEVPPPFTSQTANALSLAGAAG